MCHTAHTATKIDIQCLFISLSVVLSFYSYQNGWFEFEFELMFDMGIRNLCEKKLTFVLVYMWAGWHCKATPAGCWHVNQNIKSYIFFLYNNSVGLSCSSEIFSNPDPNQIIQLFHLPTRDQPQTGFGVAFGPSVRASLGRRVS